MASVTSIAASGELKQGQVICAFDFGTGGVWRLAICKISNLYHIFGSWNNGAWQHMATSTISGTWNEAELQPYKTAFLPYSQSALANPSAAYVSDTTLGLGLYADGKGGISTAPVTPKTTEETIAQILTGNTTTTTDGTDTAKKWYEKPLFWVLTAVGTIATILYLKNK